MTTECQSVMVCVQHTYVGVEVKWLIHPLYRPWNEWRKEICFDEVQGAEFNKNIYGEHVEVIY